jgi:hypothetical protein
VERHGPGGPTGLQNRCGRVTHGSVGSTPAPLRSTLQSVAVIPAATKGRTFYCVFILDGLPVTHTIQELRELTDEQLIAEHDAIAPHTFVGVDYYLSELARRDAHRQTRQIVLLTVAIAICTVVVTVATVFVALH